ncbi:radical SAM protein [Methanocella arvoryzae]|uniref:radical SAM protein n=1 Tax=Methanocella arvoryzae TaxID=1175445 RepID=UPI001E4F447A|nr:radical SAM protein [Methanocella arvoryzae]
MLPDSGLWKLHDELMAEYRQSRAEGKIPAGDRLDTSLLDVKIELAERLLKACCFCERRCGCDRFRKAGACGADAVSRISSEFLHRGEEPELIPSHTIFFEGCNFTCAYCQNWAIATRARSPPLDVLRMCRVIEARRGQGSANVNFVGGDPIPHLHTVLKIVRCMPEELPVIWNSNMYMTPEAMKLLDGVVDLYLADFRYGNDEHAYRYSGIRDYWKVTTRNFLEAKRQARVLVRQLVLPGHVECCTKPIVEWCAENLGKDVRFNLMFQYHPEHRAAVHPEINRPLNMSEIRRATEIVKAAGLTNLV